VIDWSELEVAYRVAEQQRRLRLGAALAELARGHSHPRGLLVSDGAQRIAEVRMDGDGHPVALLVAL
jgi:hypothetical protein